MSQLHTSVTFIIFIRTYKIHVKNQKKNELELFFRNLEFSSALKFNYDQLTFKCPDPWKSWKVTKIK